MIHLQMEGVTVQREVRETYIPRVDEWVTNQIYSSYSNYTKPERKQLLLLASISIISAVIDLNPNKINILGLTFDNLTNNTYYGIALIAVIYKLVSFYIFSTPSRIEIQKSRKDLLEKSWIATYNKPLISIDYNKCLTRSKFLLLISLQYYIPIIAGLTAIILCLIKLMQ